MGARGRVSYLSRLPMTYAQKCGASFVRGFMKVQSGLLMASLIFTSAGAMFAIPQEAKAATVTLYPTGNGTYTSWEQDWNEVDEAGTPSCDYLGGDAILGENNNEKESYTVSLAGIPNGSLITSISVDTYGRDSSVGGTNGKYQALIRFNGTDSTSSDISPTSTTACQGPNTKVFNVTDTVKGAGTTLEIGVIKANAASSGNIVVGAIRATVTYTEADTVAPTVTINQAGSQADPTYASPIKFDVVFSEAVTGFTNADVTITGTAGGSKSVSVSGSGASYEVQVTGMTTAGTVIASIPAGAAKDAANNNSAASTATDNTVLWKVNAKPVAESASYETDMNQDIDFVLGANDPDGDPLTWEIVFGQEAEHGDVTGILPNVNYDPDLGFTGEDDFSFRVFDGMDWSDAAQITIDVEEPIITCGEDEVLVNGQCVPEVPQEPGQCVVVSNTEDIYVEENAPAALAWTHNAWASIASASWIWGQTDVTEPRDGETQHFSKTFSITDVPSSATLELAADNGALVEINGEVVLDQLTGLLPADQNYDSPVASIEVSDYLVAGSNTIEITVTNLPYDTDDSKTNPAGVIYKLTMEDADCGEPADSVTIVASKLVCTDESELPNWGMGGGTIGANTATQWVADHESCSLVPGWKFQVGGQDAGDPGRTYVGEEGGYTTFGPTNASGVATVEYELGEGVTELHLREVLKHGFIPFTFDQENQSNEDDVSAEFYCQGDVLNYDNWDFIRNPVAGQTYYCVAWNVPDPEACQADAKILLKSGDADEAGLLTKVGASAAKVVGEFIHDSWLEAAGQWIWKDTGTSVEDAEDGVTETFIRTFEVVGTPMGATLEVAADNKLTVKVNGETLVTLADEDNYSATTTVAVPADMLVGGENEIEFVVENIDHESLNTPTDNPAGLMYVLTVTDNECEPYEAPQEYATVTMCKAEFLDDSESYPSLPGWTLMLLGDEVEEVSVPVDTGAGANTLASLEAGLSYVARVAGTWLNDREPDNLVDAEYSTEDGWSTQMDGFTGYGTNILELEINGTDGYWGPYNPSHEYAQAFVPAADGAANLAIDDTFHGDNSGSLAVSLYEGYAGVTGEDGCVTFENVPYGSYSVAEIAQDGWTFHGVNDQGVAVDGTTVTVNSASENFTVFNSFEDEGEDDDEDGPTIIYQDRNGSGSVTRSSSGQVAGATDEACMPLLTEYLGKSYANPSSEVTKLQEFLNGEMGSALPLTGTFGPMTEAAVRSFQVKYWEDVLKPWFAFPEFGVLDSDDSTGIVYKTTKWKINEIVCPGSEALPTLP